MGKNSGDAESASVEVILPDGFGESFSDKAVRAAFIRKVYSILLSQVPIHLKIVKLLIYLYFLSLFCKSLDHLIPVIDNFLLIPGIEPQLALKHASSLIDPLQIVR